MCCRHLELKMVLFVNDDTNYVHIDHKRYNGKDCESRDPDGSV